MPCCDLSRIENLALGIHGGFDSAKLKKLAIAPADILDFSVSTNPFGPPPGIEKALKQASIDNYPDSESAELRILLAGGNWCISGKSVNR